MKRRIVHSQQLLNLALACVLTGVLIGCGGSERPSLDIRLSTDAISVAPGETAVVEVELLRKGGFGGAVSLAVLGGPTSVATTVDTDPTGSLATLTVKVSEDAETDSQTELTVRAIGAGLASAPITRNLALSIVPPQLPPTPSVTIASPGYESSNQVRQGAGWIDLQVSSTPGLGEYTAVLESLTSFGEDVMGRVVGTTPEHRRVSFYVPSGAALGEVSLRLDTSKGPLVIPSVLEVTPIVISPDGDDENPGTFDLPLLSFTPETLAVAGDRIVLLAGEYELPSPTVIPVGVSVSGSGNVRLRPATATGVGLELAGDAVLTDLSLEGFGSALVAGTGDVRIERVQIRNAAESGIRILASSFQPEPTVKLAEVEIMNVGGVGIEVQGPGRLTGSRILVTDTGGEGILITGDSPTVLMSDITVLNAGSVNPASGVHVDHAGEGLVRLRRALISRSSSYGMEVRQGEYVDLGTSTDPGRNVLRENLEGQLLDARPARPEPDGGVISLIGTQWNGAYVGADIHTGPMIHRNPLDDQTYWVIENANNRISTGK